MRALILSAWARVAFGSLACLITAGCAGVVKSPCGDPRISNQTMPAAYLVKLPLTTDATLAADPQAAGIDPLLELQSIATASDVGQTHLSLLQATPGSECSIAEVYDAVTSNRSGAFGRRLYHSALFVWGDVFRRRGELYLQLYLRVYWNGEQGTVKVVHPDSTDDEPLEFHGRFPSSTIAFPPRRLSADMMAKWQDALGQLEPRTFAHAEAPRAAMPARFIVIPSSGGWLRLMAPDGREAWLSKGDVAARTLGLTPEFDFVHAVTAYMHFRSTRSSRSARTAIEALQRFEREYPQVWDPALRLPLAIGDVMLGTLGQAWDEERDASRRRGVFGNWFDSAFGRRTLASELQPADLSAQADASTGYVRAASRNTNDGDVLTLSALGRIPACCAGPHGHRLAAEITAGLEEAHAIDAASPTAAANLLAWYRLLARSDPSLLPIPPATLAERTQALARSLMPRP